MMQNVPGTGWDLVYLIACSLHAVKPDAQRVCAMDLDALYRLSKAQSLGSMVAGVLLGSGALKQEEILRWKEMRDKAIRKNMLLDAERSQLCAYLEQEGIWYLPLKGVVLQNLYPAYGMRQMGDNDLLVDENGLESIKEYMLACGYQSHGGGDYNHAYTKPPVYNFEIHWSLIKDGWNLQNKEAYYENVQDKLLPGESPFARMLSCEDQYIYLIVHAYKHANAGGTGLRAAVDQFVCARAWQDMDAAYVQAELEKLGIAAFEKTLRGLAQKLFAQPCAPMGVCLAPEEETLLSSMLGSGTYGNFDNRVKNRMRKLSGGKDEEKGLRGRYLLGRLFPTAEQMKERFPVLRRAVWLLPVMYVYRILYGGIVRGGKIRREISIVWKQKQP